MKYIQLKTTEINALKLKILEEQGYKDAITHKPLQPSNAVLDHQHRLRKNQLIGEDGAGLVRGVLDRQVNMAEGKISNALRRFCACTTTQEKIVFLQGLIEYYQQEPTVYIHPTEKPVTKAVSKRQYNKLKKLFHLKYANRKFPDYPKSGKCTKSLQKLFEDFKISPF